MSISVLKAKPEFGRYWRVPGVMYDLLDAPWARTTTPFDISGA